ACRTISDPHLIAADDDFTVEEFLDICSERICSRTGSLTCAADQVTEDDGFHFGRRSHPAYVFGGGVCFDNVAANALRVRRRAASNGLLLSRSPDLAYEYVRPAGELNEAGRVRRVSRKNNRAVGHVKPVAKGAVRNLFLRPIRKVGILDGLNRDAFVTKHF